MQSNRTDGATMDGNSHPMSPAPPMTLENVRKAVACLSAKERSSLEKEMDGSCYYDKIKEAEQALLAWEHEDPSSYVIMLSEIFDAKDVDLATALGCMLMLKAAIKRHWKENLNRTEQMKTLSEDAKEETRKLLISVICRQDSRWQQNKLMQQNAAASVAMIGRIDLPIRSHTIVPTLVLHCSPECSLFETRNNAALALYAVLEELSEKRLPMDKKYLVSVAMSHFNTIATAYSDSLIVASERHSHIEERKYAMAMAKIVHTLLLVALSRLLGSSLEGNVNSMFAMSLHILQVSLQHQHNRRRILSSDAEQDMKEEEYEYVKELANMAVDLQAHHPIGFGRYLSQYLDFFYSVCRYPQLSPAFLVLTALQFLSQVSNCTKYDPDEAKNEALEDLRSQSHISGGTEAAIEYDEETVKQMVSVVWSGFFTTERISNLLQVILSLMKPSLDTLISWQTNPELHYLECVKNQDSIPASAQNLLLALMETTKGRQVLTAQLRTFAEDYNLQSKALDCQLNWSPAPRGSNSLLPDASVLFFDAVYTAVGISVNTMCKVIDFNTWFETVIEPSLTQYLTPSKAIHLHPIPVIRVRLIWLIGCHANCLSFENYQLALQTLTGFLLDESGTSNSNLVLKLTIIDSLNALLSDSEHGLTTSLPIEVLSYLFHLSETSRFSELDCKTKVTSLIIVLLSSPNAAQYFGCPQILNIYLNTLSTLWHSNAGTVLQTDILQILSCMISKVQDEATLLYLHSIVVPLISNVLDPVHRNKTLFLEEDALSLWLSLIEYSWNFSSLHELFPQVEHAIREDDFSHLKTVMRIIQGYIVFGKLEFLNMYANTISTILCRTIGQVSTKATSYVSLVFEALLCQCPVQGGQLLLSSGIIKTMLSSCAMRYRLDDNHDPDIVVVQYLTSLARIVIACPTILDSFVKSEGDARSFIELYFQLFETAGCSTGGHLHRKIWIMLLLSFIPGRDNAHPIFSQQVLKCMDQFINVCVDFLKTECRELSSYSVDYDSDEEQLMVNDDRNLYTVRLQQEMSKEDVGFKFDVKALLKEKMDGCSQALGTEAYFDVMSTVEPVLLTQLEKLM